jgi:hypothetical protein
MPTLSHQPAPNTDFGAVPSTRHFLRILSCAVVCGMILATALLLSNCGSPGVPTPPRPAIPAPITDLTVQQQGVGVVLMFSLSNQRTTEGQPFPRTPDIEIYREVESAYGRLSQPTELMYTIPGGLMDTYGAQNHFRFTDPLQPGDFARYAHNRLAYAVWASFSGRFPSAPSNIAALQVFPPARAVTSLSVVVTKSAIELSWTPPTETVIGAPITIVGGYRVYRAEVAPDNASDAIAHHENAKLLAPFSLLGVTPAAEYQDATFQFGRAYLYSVRAVLQYGTASVESDESQWASAIPRDIFPPAPPQGLEAVGLPAIAGLPAHVELSWTISPEADVQGYNVYRDESTGIAMQRLNPAPLPTPVFRDMTAQAGRRYVYQVTAMSKAGIESPRSAEASATVPVPGGENQ